MSVTQAALVAMLVEECDCARGLTRPSSRLVEDLGIDGDDAAELFAAIADRFGTKLSGLSSEWERHFRPQMTSWPNRLALWSCVLGGALLALSLHVSAVWGLGFCLGLIALRTWELSTFPREATVPLSVADVAAAIERGAWKAPSSTTLSYSFGAKVDARRALG